MKAITYKTKQSA